MGVDLLKHNQEAFQEINKLIESGIKKIAVPRATGSGKTYLMGALAEQYNNDKKLVLEPTRPLLNSIEEKFDEFGIANTDFIPYQKLIRISDEDIAAMDYKLIFLDECHHCVSPVWGKKVNYLMETHSDSIILGTSATTVRNDGVNVVETIFDNNAIGELPLSTAIARKVLPCPHYITAVYRLDDEFEKLKKRIENATNTKSEKKEFYKKMQEMKIHFEKSYGIPLILNKYIRVKNGKYLVFCKNKKHLDAMRDVVIDWFHTSGIKDVHSYAVYSDYPDKEKDYKDFCEDNSDSPKILFSINILNEGLHIKDISGVLMLRTTQSNLIYLQQLGRLVEAENLDKYLVVFDFVNNFSSVNDGIGLLREIKDAIAKEKESDPDFDDSGFEDIDTYFVIDQVVEIQEMFREIEGRLVGSWDFYIKALKQYKEREGDCLVPRNHIEVVDGVKMALGNWCKSMRKAKKDEGTCLLTKEREEQLNQEGFIWNVYQYNFEKKIKQVAEYYKENKKYPFFGSGNFETESLAQFLSIEKMYIRKEDYPQYKRDIIEKYLPEFSCEKRRDKQFNELLEYLKLYKYRYHNLNIKARDVIDGYKIGEKLNFIKGEYNKKKLSEDKIRKLEEVGVYFGSAKEWQFRKKMELAKQAVKNGITISRINEVYKGVDLYNWIRCSVKKKYEKDELMKDEIEIIEKLTGKKLDGSNTQYEKNFELCREMVGHGINVNTQKVYMGVNIYNWIHNHRNQFSDKELVIINQLMPPNPQNISVRIIDLMNQNYQEYASISEAGRALHNEFKVIESDDKGIKAIQRRLTGKIKNPVYKDRFRFEYVDDKVG